MQPVAPHELAAPGKRFVGRFVDNLTMLLPILLPVGAMVAVGSGSHDARLVLPVVGAVFGVLAYAGLQVFQLQKTGQTVGKRVAGTRVVALDGSPVGMFRACFGRDLVIFVLNATRLFGLINGLMVFASSRRCGHDYLLGTVVVDVAAFDARESDIERVADVFR